MNLTELARRLKVGTEELKEKLPQLGFDIGRKAIKINPKDADRIMRAWSEMRRREEVERRYTEQKEAAERARLRKEGILPTKKVNLPAVFTVREFAGRLGLPVTEVMKVLMKSGILASMNERLDFDTATIVAEDLGYAVEKEEKAEDVATTQALDSLKEVLDAADEKKMPRPPVVVIMGHVDHGKTTLLDAIRKTSVAAGEAGGITQHIGAYQIKKKGRDITFIDTPGHEAFTVMRSRGAKVADIAILVVAADDSVQPQTKEAVNIIQAARLPLVVAINKIDKPDANIEKTKTQLSEIGVQPEDWGGKIPFVAISAKKNQHIDELLDVLLLVADMEKERISANPDRRAIGTVVEAHVDKGEGAVGTVLVQAGTLRTGDVLGVRGTLFGKVRAMKNWRGELVKEATPGMPVKILGLRAAPAVGDILEVPENASDLEVTKVMRTTAVNTVSSERVAQPTMDAGGEKKFLNIAIRTDVLGSLEAIIGKLEKVADEKVGIRIVAKGLGNVNESDIETAAASGAVVYGFNVRVVPQVAMLARDKGVEVREHKIIYEIFEDIERRLNLIVPPEVTVVEQGSLEVLAVFKRESGFQIVGARVKKGKITSKAKVRIFRNGQIIGEGEIGDLRSGKQQVTEARQSEECGIQIKTKERMEIGDTLEAYFEDKKVRKLAM